jgi:hypothetical protein
MVFCQCAYPLDDKTAKLLWQQSPVPTQQQLELWTYHVQASGLTAMQPGSTDT